MVGDQNGSDKLGEGWRKCKERQLNLGTLGEQCGSLVYTIKLDTQGTIVYISSKITA
jgi:hypothetical protein